VGIDMRVAFTLKTEVEFAMLGKKFKHMVKKANSGVYCVLPAPIDVE